MPELIDKERAYTALKHEQYTHGLSFSAEAFEKAARIIDQMPAIEAEPVRHGRWTDNGEDKFICSVCGGYVYRWFGKSDFCPNCGSMNSEV